MVRLDDANATSVYGVSVDSRSRPPSQPDNKYDISLGRTLDRVKSLQLGSIQIPDCRYAFDTKSVLQYSEPITILPQTHLFINEEVRTLNTVANTCTVENRVIQLLLPPTLNKIVNYQASLGPATDDGIVSAQSPTGLQFALSYYPLVGVTPSVVGAHFPQTLMSSPMAPFPPSAGPVLTTTTVTVNNGGYYEPDGYDVLDNGFQYTAGYLDALTSTAGDYDKRHVLFDGPSLCAWSYIYCPPLTLTELFTVLNAALADKVNAQDLSGTITQIDNPFGSLEFTTPGPHGLHTGDQVVISGTSWPPANGTFFVVGVPSSTTFFVNSALIPPVLPFFTAGAYISPQRLHTQVQFGYDDANSRVIAVGPSVKQSTGTGYIERVYSFTTVPPFNSLARYLGFGSQRLDPQAIANVPAYIFRTVQLRKGNYTADELTAITTVRMNPLLFHQQTAAKRTLQYKLPTGTPASLVIPCGRYTATQLVNFLNSALNPAPANILVSVNEASGKFTFTQQFGLPFMLLFEGDDNLFMAYNLGFEPVNYSGASSYTSTFNALQGVAAANGGYAVNRYPSNTYWVTADPTQSHFTFDTGCPDNPQLVATSGTNDATVCPHTAVWNPVYDCTSLSDGWSAAWFPGDVLYAQAPHNYGLVASFQGCVITTVAPHDLVDGQSVTLSCGCLVGTFTVTVLSNTSFLIAPCDVDASCTGTGGTFVSNSTPDNAFYANYKITNVSLVAAGSLYTATITMAQNPPPGIQVGSFIKLFAVPESNVEGVWEVTAIVGATVTAVRTSSTVLTFGPGSTSGYYLPFSLAVGTIANLQASATVPLVEIVTAAPHGLATGDYVKITGATEANGLWQVAVTGASTFDLVGSTFVGPGGAGGTFAQVSGLVSDAANATPVVITSAAALSGVVSNEAVSVLQVGGNDGANGTYMAIVTGLNTFELLGSVGTGAYTSGGFYLLNSALLLPATVATNTYTVVVKEAPSMLFGGPPTLPLEPTVSIFSLLDAGSINQALGEPAADRLIYLQAALRDVFQLFFFHPDSKAANFGFPPVSWPPSTKTLQQFYAPAFPTYDAACQCVPVSNTYQSPYCWNLLPPDYILMLLCAPCGSKDVHTHTWKKDTKPILAKLYITSPYLNISEQMLFSTFAGFQRINQVSVEFQNPDGSLVEFNGRPHSYELLFTLYEDSANATCL